MQTLELSDEAVEQLQTHTRTGETPSQALTRLLNEATPEPTMEPEQLAERAVTIRDLREMDQGGWTAAEYLNRAYNLDAADYATEDELRAALREAR